MGDKLNIVRFPEMISGWKRSIFIGCMIGLLKRVERTSNTGDGAMLSVLELLWEWVVKKYRISDIESAIRQANVLGCDLFLKFLRDIGSRPRFPMRVS